MNDIYAKEVFKKGKEIRDLIGLEDKSDNPKIMFQGKEWILVGGAITTQEAYDNFEPSYAHLFPDGRIMRYRNQIGTKEDITFLNNEESK